VKKIGWILIASGAIASLLVVVVSPYYAIYVLLAIAIGLRMINGKMIDK